MSAGSINPAPNDAVYDGADAADGSKAGAPGVKKNKSDLETRPHPLATAPVERAT